MALKRLDEEFDLKPGTQLLPYMKRLLPSLEGRFQSLEATAEAYSHVMEDIRATALTRMNEILIPATEDIIEVTKLGFLLGPSSTPITLSLGLKYFYIDEGPQRNSFTPSPYVIVEREANIDDYAIARVMDYVQETGELVLQITAWHGNAGPHSDWVISSTPGMADSTKLYHDAIGPMYDQVVIDSAQVAADKIELIAAMDALEAAGLDAQAFIRREGTVPFIGQQIGVAPAPGSNDAHLVTSAWSRARMIEYTLSSVSRFGDTMGGPLYLARDPVAPTEAVTKRYADAATGLAHWVDSWLGVRGVNPALRLQSAGAQQNRVLEALSSAGVLRWQMRIADNALKSGGDVGSNFVLARYGDGGAFLDNALTINRQTGAMTTKALTAEGGLVVNGNVSTRGEIFTYRSISPTTGLIYMNQANTAYHHFDGATHQLGGGGVSVGANPITGGHLSCYSINTQGYGATVWGMTSHGHLQINSSMNVQHIQVNSTGPLIVMSDTDWGLAYVHHQAGNIGFLNYNGAWVWYVNYNGHFWTPQYGWMHDYVNNQASYYAWYAADYRYNQVVIRNRWVYVGDVSTSHGNGSLVEPYGGAAITGFAGYNGYNTYVIWFRFRQLQQQINGGWYAVGYA